MGLKVYILVVLLVFSEFLMFLLHLLRSAVLPLPDSSRAMRTVFGHFLYLKCQSKAYMSRLCSSMPFTCMNMSFSLAYGTCISMISS